MFGRKPWALQLGVHHFNLQLHRTANCSTTSSICGIFEHACAMAHPVEDFSWKIHMVSASHTLNEMDGFQSVIHDDMCQTGVSTVSSSESNLSWCKSLGCHELSVRPSVPLSHLSPRVGFGWPNWRCRHRTLPSTNHRCGQWHHSSKWKCDV